MSHRQLGELDTYIFKKLGIPTEEINMHITLRAGEDQRKIGDQGELNALKALQIIDENIQARKCEPGSDEDQIGIDIIAVFPDLIIDEVDIQVKTNASNCKKHLHALCEELDHPYDEKLPIRMAQEGKMLVRGNSVECAIQCFQTQLKSFRQYWAE